MREVLAGPAGIVLGIKAERDFPDRGAEPVANPLSRARVIARDGYVRPVQDIVPRRFAEFVLLGGEIDLRQAPLAPEQLQLPGEVHPREFEPRRVAVEFRKKAPIVVRSIRQLFRLVFGEKIDDVGRLGPPILELAPVAENICRQADSRKVVLDARMHRRHQHTGVAAVRHAGRAEVGALSLRSPRRSHRHALSK